VWASFGRRVVLNLTTVTNSVRGFTTLLLGRFLTEKMIEKHVARDRDALSIFLRMEQISAYVRRVGHGVEGEIRGIERVKAHLEENSAEVPIQDDSSGMILSDQKTYGLWGLYSVSARISGISSDGPVGLTPFAKEFCEKYYWPRLGRIEKPLFKILSRGGWLKLRKSDPVFKVMVEIFPALFSRQEREFYGEALRDAGQVSDGHFPGRQDLFARLLARHTDIEDGINREEVKKLARAARREDEGLAHRLEKILRLEALLAPAEAIFDYLQARNGQRPSDLAATLHDHWGGRVPNLDRAGFHDILPEITDIVGARLATVMDRCDETMSAGDYEEGINALLEWNKLIMASRKAAPWISLKAGKLDVRYRGLEKQLPSGDRLEHLWRNSYFIDSLKDITRQLNGVS